MLSLWGTGLRVRGDTTLSTDGSAADMQNVKSGPNELAGSADVARASTNQICDIHSSMAPTLSGIWLCMRTLLDLPLWVVYIQVSVVIIPFVNFVCKKKSLGLFCMHVFLFTFLFTLPMPGLTDWLMLLTVLMVGSARGWFTGASAVGSVGLLLALLFSLPCPSLSRLCPFLSHPHCTNYVHCQLLWYGFKGEVFQGDTRERERERERMGLAEDWSLLITPAPPEEEKGKKCRGGEEEEF